MRTSKTLNALFQAASQEMYNATGAQGQPNPGEAGPGFNANPQQGQPGGQAGGKNDEVTDVDFEEVK